MASTREGRRKSIETLKKKLGEQGYRDYMSSLGARGGKKKVKKGLAVTGNQYRRRKLRDLEDEEN